MELFAVKGEIAFASMQVVAKLNGKFAAGIALGPQFSQPPTNMPKPAGITMHDLASYANLNRGAKFRLCAAPSTAFDLGTKALLSFASRVSKA